MCAIFLGCYDLGIELTRVDELRASGVTRRTSKVSPFFLHLTPLTVARCNDLIVS